MSKRSLTPDERQKEVDLIHLEVGRLIDEWSHVEHVLNDIFVQVATPHDGSISYTLSASFWSVQGVENKLKLITAAIKNMDDRKKVDSVIVDEWTKVKVKVQRRNKRRNKLAHGCITPSDIISKEPPAWIPYFDSWGFAISSAESSKKRIGAPTYERLTKSDLEAMRSDFKKLRIELYLFLKRYLDLYIG